MMEQLLELSRRYGAGADYVLAGGGNASWKNDGAMFVKASGTALADAAAESFVAMDCRALLDMLNRPYPENDDEREATALAAELNAAHGPGRAMAVAVNVADEASVQQMVHHTVLAYGGLDLLVSCA